MNESKNGIIVKFQYMTDNVFFIAFFQNAHLLNVDKTITMNPKQRVPKKTNKKKISICQPESANIRIFYLKKNEKKNSRLHGKFM